MYREKGGGSYVDLTTSIPFALLGELSDCSYLLFLPVTGVFASRAVPVVVAVFRCFASLARCRRARSGAGPNRIGQTGRSGPQTLTRGKLRSICLRLILLSRFSWPDTVGGADAVVCAGAFSDSTAFDFLPADQPGGIITRLVAASESAQRGRLVQRFVHT